MSIRTFFYRRSKSFLKAKIRLLEKNLSFNNGVLALETAARKCLQVRFNVANSFWKAAYMQIESLNDEAEKLKRSNAALRGQIRKMKADGKDRSSLRKHRHGAPKRRSCHR
jgi:phage major head subunit gpT-like protein